MPLTRADLDPDEYARFYATYVDVVPPEQTIARALAVSQHCLDAWFDALAPQRFGYAYATGKWTVAQVIRHLIDSERVFAYRALWIARGAADPLPGFDQEAFAKTAGEAVDAGALREELKFVRRSSGLLFASLDDEALARTGVASGAPVSARALGFITAGHSYHHARVLAGRYGVPHSPGGSKLSR